MKVHESGIEQPFVLLLFLQRAIQDALFRGNVRQDIEIAAQQGRLRGRAALFNVRGQAVQPGDLVRQGSVNPALAWIAVGRVHAADKQIADTDGQQTIVPAIAARQSSVQNFGLRPYDTG